MVNKKLVYNRRHFVKTSAKAGLVLASAGKTGNKFGPEPTRPVRIGFVGLGSRGMSMLKVALSLEGVEVPVVCDIVESKVERAQSFVEEVGQPKPKGFT